MPNLYTAVKYVRLCYGEGEGVIFLNQLRIPDEGALNPLQIALLSLKCYKMGFVLESVQCGVKDYVYIQ